MKKALNIVGITTGVILACLIGRCFYMVACISCTIPHIKDYQCAASVQKFETALKKLTHDHQNITYKITDTVGDKDMGFAYETSIKLTDSVNNFLYEIKYEEKSKNNLIVGLIGAHDLNKNTGGYGSKADGMNEILKVFDMKILNTLSREQHIALKQIDL